MPQASETKNAYSWRTPRSRGFTGSVGKMFTLGTVPLPGLAVWGPSRMACDNWAMASERLSDVLRETDGQVFRDEEFAAHLERVAASEDDLSADPPA